MTLGKKIRMIQAGAAGLARESLRTSNSPHPKKVADRRSYFARQPPGSRFLSEAATPKPSIKLQILLRREWRTPQGVETVQGLLRSLGLMPTAGGLATISADIEPEKLEEIFGVTATETAPQPPGGREFGRSGGNISPELKVPAALSDYVESISAAPGHIYLQK
jgi:hypothetical protein